MEFINSILISLAQQFYPFLGEISLAIVATILAIYGDCINKKIKKLVKDKPFIIRYASFISLCAFGYGFLTLFFAKILSKAMKQLPMQYFVIAIVGCFFALGILADRKNQI